MGEVGTVDVVDRPVNDAIINFVNGCLHCDKASVETVDGRGSVSYCGATNIFVYKIIIEDIVNGEEPVIDVMTINVLVNTMLVNDLVSEAVIIVIDISLQDDETEVIVDIDVVTFMNGVVTGFIVDACFLDGGSEEDFLSLAEVK
ncbi:hypothetical protein NDU88_000296 [Pleurodeles waltl]|uniref:Uncharacterized protein n=1 Tax=Pleurodeles waltl TaxID=8319 RepID=A0AAV7SW10_PLEWA|nr:hypothetical protein NDU88_000296 [Pleurodeles waltl]